MVDDEAAAAIEHGAEVEERAADVDVRDVDVPVLVGIVGLLKARALLRCGPWPSGQQAGLLQHAVHRRWADRDHVGIEHHEGQASVAIAGMSPGKGTDGLPLPIRQPVLLRGWRVMYVALPVSLLPFEEPASMDSDPADEVGLRQAGLLAPVRDEVEELVADVVGSP